MAAVSPGPRFPSVSSPGPSTPCRSAEIRFWWPGDAPGSLSEWFADGATGPVEKRTDHYYPTGSPGLGVKLRSGNGPLEVKALAGEVKLPGGSRRAAIWARHEIPLGLVGGSTRNIAKSRRLRRFALSDGGPRECGADGDADCEIELAEVELEGSRWASLCFEAASPISDPLACLAPVWQSLRPRGLLGARVAGYPEFLLDVARLP